VAARSGDTAFARAGRERTNENFCPLEGGVALRFPPQSMSRLDPRERPPKGHSHSFTKNAGRTIFPQKSFCQTRFIGVS
jgi:hypothetical protein